MRPGETIPPMLPAAAAIYKQRHANYMADRPSARCLPHGIPDQMLIRVPMKILQNPGLTLILYEEFARFRQVFTDGHAHPPVANPAWLDYSIGHWDDDWFVVDTRGFNDKSWLDDSGRHHTEALHTVERFRRRDFGHLDVEGDHRRSGSLHPDVVVPHAIRVSGGHRDDRGRLRQRATPTTPAGNRRSPLQPAPKRATGLCAYTRRPGSRGAAPPESLGLRFGIPRALYRTECGIGLAKSRS